MQNILDIIVMENEETFEKKQSQIFFLQYVKEADSTKLSNILQFVTGFTRIPLWKMEKGIILKYLEDDDKKMLPESMACFNILYLPAVHSNQISFINTLTKHWSLKHLVLALHINITTFENFILL